MEKGGYQVNSQGERCMQRYAAKAMELAPRDIVSRSIQKEIDAGLRRKESLRPPRRPTSGQEQNPQ